MPVAVASDPQEIEAIQEAENESMGAETAVLIRRLIALSHNFRKSLENDENNVNHEDKKKQTPMLIAKRSNKQ